MGHLKDIDGEKIWKSIIIGKFEGYSDKIAVSQITISKPSILRRFRKMNSNRNIEKQIKPFNFMLIGSEKNDIIPCLPFDKNTRGIEYKPFIDYKSDTASDRLPLPTIAYWITLDDVFTQYVMQGDYKFDYDNEGIAHKKHILANRIRYIGEETNNLDETQITGIEEDDYLEYHDVMEFYNWILWLKPKDVRDKGISQQALYKFKTNIKNGKPLSPKVKVVKVLLKLFKVNYSIDRES
ncbi:hypothetical protein [Caldiplasma sukawensis]